MVKRIFAIFIIFVFTSIAWGILGATIFSRTYSSDSNLKDRVETAWGSSQRQTPPSAFSEESAVKNVESVENGKYIVKKVTEIVENPLPLESSRINVAFDLDYRQKGLLWYSAYKVSFLGVYKFQNDSKSDDVKFVFQFPASQAVYDDLIFTLNDQPLQTMNEKNSIKAFFNLPKGDAGILKVSYKSQGLTEWRYDFGSEVSQVRDFSLTMQTNFKDIDFPENALSPSQKRETSKGWELNWSYRNLLSGFQIGMVMPEKLQPGPLAGEISLFAPVSLFFFFFLMFIITTMRGIDLHPMNYFFLGAGFFAFHLLLAYLVDHISIHYAFAICSTVSIFLVVSYLRLVVGMRFAAGEAALAQFVYLVLFSYAFFFKGFTGLAITIGSILTLFVVMQMTGRINWSDKFARKAPDIQPKTD